MVFFILVLMLPQDNFRIYVNKALLPLKLLFGPCLFIWICSEDDFFIDGMVNAVKYLGLIYLIIQDFIYNEVIFRWILRWNKKKQSNSCNAVLYYVFILSSLVVMILLLVLNVKWNWKSCFGAKKFWIILNIIILISNYVLTGINKYKTKRSRDDINFLGTTLISLYTNYYFYYGVSSITERECSTKHTSTILIIFEILISSTLILILFIIISYFKSLYLIRKNEKEEIDGNVIKREIILRIKDEKNKEEDGEANNQKKPRFIKYVWIFTVYTFLVLYFQNTINNWAFGQKYVYSNNQPDYYIKIVNACFNSLIYIQVLIVPIVMENKKTIAKKNQEQYYLC